MSLCGGQGRTVNQGINKETTKRELLDWFDINLMDNRHCKWVYILKQTFQHFVRHYFKSCRNQVSYIVANVTIMTGIKRKALNVLVTARH